MVSSDSWHHFLLWSNEAYYRFHFALKSSQVTNLLFLARSMCVNLSSMSYGSEDEESKYGNLDHLRAYAGKYYLNTL